MKTFEIWTRQELCRCYVVKAENVKDAKDKFHNWDGEDSEELYWDEDADVFVDGEIDEINEVTDEK